MIFVDDCQLWMQYYFNTLRPRQNGRHFADDTFKHIFLNENVLISIEISLKFVPKGPVNNMRALVQIMAWRRPGDKPLSEPMMVRLPTHKCVTQPQWVKPGPFTTRSSVAQNRPMSQIPECICSISHNGAFWDMEQVHSGICELGQLHTPQVKHRLDLKLTNTPYVSSSLVGYGVSVVGMFNTLCLVAETKWPTFCRRHFQTHLLKWKW